MTDAGNMTFWAPTTSGSMSGPRKFIDIDGCSSFADVSCRKWCIAQNSNCCRGPSDPRLSDDYGRLNHVYTRLAKSQPVVSGAVSEWLAFAVSAERHEQRLLLCRAQQHLSPVPAAGAQ